MPYRSTEIKSYFGPASKFRHGEWYLVPDLIFQSGFKFLGYRFGKKYDKLPLWLVKKFSMNPSYWRDKE